MPITKRHRPRHQRGVRKIRRVKTSKKSRRSGKGRKSIGYRTRKVNSVGGFGFRKSSASNTTFVNPTNALDLYNLIKGNSPNNLTTYFGKRPNEVNKVLNENKIMDADISNLNDDYIIALNSTDKDYRLDKLIELTGPVMRQTKANRTFRSNYPSINE